MPTRTTTTTTTMSRRRTARTVSLEQDSSPRIDLLAERNRGWFAGREVLAINLMSSPGAGKTSILERTIRDLRGALPIAVLEGDQATAAMPTASAPPARRLCRSTPAPAATWMRIWWRTAWNG